MLVVTTPASSYDLVTLADTKSYLDIAGSSEDVTLGLQISAASELIEKHIDRVLVVETVEEVLRNPAPVTGGINLQRWPVNSIVSLTEAGITLTSEAYELHVRAGLLYRLAGDEYGKWGSPVVVRYSAGYSTIPAAVREACFLMVKAIRETVDREAGVKSERLDGMSSTSYVTLFDGGLPPEVSSRLDGFKESSV